VDDEELQASAKRYFKEFLMFAVFPEGATDDFKRWEDKTPCKGWSYSAGQIGDMVILADHFARAGDMELYNYSTTHGFYGTQGRDRLTGQPKSLLTTIRWHQAYMNGKMKRYGTDSSGRNGNRDYMIDTDCSGTKPYVHDLRYGPMANVFYRDQHIQDNYMRTASNIPSYPSNPSLGEFAWGGNWGSYPGLLFMFGQMENKVWPYPKPGRQELPAPRNLKLLQ
jgi:hypothetical protein